MGEFLIFALADTISPTTNTHFIVKSLLLTENLNATSGYTGPLRVLHLDDRIGSNLRCIKMIRHE